MKSMQLVYEFGATELDPVVETIQRALVNVECSVKSMANDSDTYSPTAESFRAVASKLKQGELASFSLHPNRGLIRYALVTCPFFAGNQLSAYLGTIEYLGDEYKALWNLILATRGLSFVCLGFEEGVEIDDSILSIESFPWNQWPLVIGAIRDKAGSQPWQIRPGPEMKWFAKAL